MDNLSLETELTGLEKKLIKAGRKDFVEEIHLSDFSQRQSRTEGLEKHRQALVTTKANDEELKAAQRKARELNKVYTDQMNMNASLARYIYLKNVDQGHIDPQEGQYAEDED